MNRTKPRAGTQDRPPTVARNPSMPAWRPRGTPPGSPPPRVLRKADALARIGVSSTTLWRLERSGRFPRSFRLSPGLVGWREQDVTGWIEKRARPSEHADAPHAGSRHPGSLAEPLARKDPR